MARQPKPRWPEGWHPVGDLQRAAFTTQLLVELGRRSPHRDHVEAVIGGFDGSDDVVVAMRDWQAPYAVAHLSWEKADRRPALIQRFFPRPGYAPALQPLNRIADLAHWFD